MFGFWKACHVVEGDKVHCDLNLFSMVMEQYKNWAKVMVLNKNNLSLRDTRRKN